VARDTGQTSTTFTVANSPYNAFDLLGESGRSNFDIPNKFIANAVWQPESKNKFLKDWTFSPIFAAYSGAPLNVVVSGSIPSPGITQDPACWPGAVTTNQCSTPGGGVNGSGGAARFTLIPRNQVSLPKIWNLDLRISRRIRFKESQALEFLIEGFNLFNRTQVTGENNSIYTVSSTAATCNAAHNLCTPASATLSPTLSAGISTFQQVNAAGGTLFRERQIQWAIRYQF
jgi:hypothetical protein